MRRIVNAPLTRLVSVCALLCLGGSAQAQQFEWQKATPESQGMSAAALDKLKDATDIDLDPERKAAMVSNLLVVLVSDKDATPVVNTGTIYA